MAEALRKVAQLFAGRGVDLLRQQTDIVGVLGSVLEGRVSLIVVASQGEGVSQPERTQGESALTSRQAIGCPVAVHEAVLRQVPLDASDRRADARVGRGQKADARDDQDRKSV